MMNLSKPVFDFTGTLTGTMSGAESQDVSLRVGILFRTHGAQLQIQDARLEYDDRIVMIEIPEETADQILGAIMSANR
jgi:hypothetical protein